MKLNLHKVVPMHLVNQQTFSELLLQGFAGPVVYMVFYIYMFKIIDSPSPQCKNDQDPDIHQGRL